MQRLKTTSALLAATLAAAPAAHAAPSAPPPKLVIAIIVDQFRFDYTTRFRARYTGGLARMLNGGAVFLDAHQDHFPTVTATGHAAYLSGGVPATTGIVANEWYDRATGKTVTSVEDAETTLLGVDGKKEGSSPHNLIVSTLGDELKISDRGASKVIGISMKDRAAILPSGRMADAAYWVDGASGAVVSSTWYAPQLPAWVQSFNAGKPALKALGALWSPVGGGAPFMTLPSSPGKAYFSKWEQTPYANDMLEELAERALHNEHLGQGKATDILTVSFSANDHLGHAVGPDDPSVEDMCVRTDQVLGKLLAAAEKQVGKQNLLVVLSADHGVAPVPEVNKRRKMPGGRIDKDEYVSTVESALTRRFGEGKWILATGEAGFYLNSPLIESKHVSLDAVEDEVVLAVLKLPYVERAYAGHELLKHTAAASDIDEYMQRGFFPERSPDVMVAIKPYYLFGTEGTSHGSPYNYDSHVPLIFYGSNVQAGTYAQPVGISDVAPTLAAVLHIQAPSGSVGHILSEVALPHATATPRAYRQAVIREDAF